MDPLSSGTLVGAGSYRCTRCDYALTLSGSDVLPECPACGGARFSRASLFSTERIIPKDGQGEQATIPAASKQLQERLVQAREGLTEPGEYLCYEEGGKLRTVALKREWTRIGRSLAADVRFDDPTVSRRHALIVRHPDGVRLLDDRSLNGVFVNGSRVDGKTLQDGDEIVVGRYQLVFVSVAADPEALGGPAREDTLHPIA